MDMVVAGASLIFATVYDTIGNVRGQEMLICTSVISGGSTSGLDETATKRSFTAVMTPRGPSRRRAVTIGATPRCVRNGHEPIAFRRTTGHG